MHQKKYEELTFTDDFMFCKILMSNPALCKELLELVLNIKIKKVVDVNKQKSIDITADAKGVRLDVYVEDTEETVYDVEMQTKITKDLPKRSRYYQGMIDLNQIERGAKYSDLKKSYIIFLCLKDPFDRNLAVYTFENTCREDQSLFLGDKTIKIFVNASGTTRGMSKELHDFLRYLRDGVAEKDTFASRIDEKVKKARRHEEWRSEYMTLQMHYDEIAEEAREEGWEKGLEEGRVKGLEEGRVKGLEEGREEIKTVVIKEMMKEGIAVEIIAKCCKEIEDNVRMMVEKMKNE